ncbi:MAG: HEAT repeat protein, partial [Rhodothermales bacterium]
MRACLLLLFVSFSLHADIAKLVDPLVAALPGNALSETDDNLQKVIDAGAPAFVYLCSKLADEDGRKDGKVRWMMQGISHRILGSKNNTARKALERALLDSLASDKHGTHASTFLLRQLRIIGTVDALVPIGKQLKKNELVDPSVQALLAIANSVDHKRVASQLRPALPHVTVIKALGSLRDTNSIPAFIEATKSADSTTRLVGLRALSNTGDARGLPVLKSAAESAKGYEQNRALANYLQLATTLKKADICREVFATYTGPEHGHIQTKALSDLAGILGEDAAADLNKALDHKSTYVRDVAGRLLTDLPGESISQGIADKLESEDAGTRKTAVTSL